MQRARQATIEQRHRPHPLVVRSGSAIAPAGPTATAKRFCRVCWSNARAASSTPSPSVPVTSHTGGSCAAARRRDQTRTAAQGLDRSRRPGRAASARARRLRSVRTHHLRVARVRGLEHRDRLRCRPTARPAHAATAVRPLARPSWSRRRCAARADARRPCDRRSPRRTRIRRAPAVACLRSRSGTARGTSPRRRGPSRSGSSRGDPTRCDRRSCTFVASAPLVASTPLT